MSFKKKIGIGVCVLLLLIAAGFAAVFGFAKYFTAQENAVRTAWAVDVGPLLGRDEDRRVELRQAALESDLAVLQLVPFEVGEEGFTYYNIQVQDRLAQTLTRLQAGREGQSWTADAPLAVLNPYGTGSNGLYLYFETDFPTQVSYTIQTQGEEIPDFTALAPNGDGQTYSRTHEFQLIGLVPGQTSQVTLTLTGSWGNVRQQVTFSITMPETMSGYPVQLDYTDGTSGQPLSDGLYAMMRTNGYLGYGFFFDNAGVLRYEIVLEGFGLDRILFDGGDIITCVSSQKLARISPLGRVEQVCELGEYELHHDIVPGPDGTVVALVERQGAETVEDIVIQADLATGELVELVDFSQLMSGFREEETHPVPITGEFFWQAGEWDWIHLKLYNIGRRGTP